jgi:hypothetical protein
MRAFFYFFVLLVHILNDKDAGYGESRQTRSTTCQRRPSAKAGFSFCYGKHGIDEVPAGIPAAQKPG